MIVGGRLPFDSARIQTETATAHTWHRIFFQGDTSLSLPLIIWLFVTICILTAKSEKPNGGIQHEMEIVYAEWSFNGA